MNRYNQSMNDAEMLAAREAYGGCDMVNHNYDHDAGLRRRFMLGMLVGVLVLFALQALPYVLLPGGF